MTSIVQAVQRLDPGVHIEYQGLCLDCRNHGKLEKFFRPAKLWGEMHVCTPRD